MTVHGTLIRFGYPGTLVAEYRHWAVVLRPAQATLGALVLIARAEALAFGDLPPEAFAEMGRAVSDTEAALRAAFNQDRINYLMLMMVDPHVHFHVLPRYRETRSMFGTSFADPGWPGPPDLRHETPLAEAQRAALRETLAAHWPSPA